MKNYHRQLGQLKITSSINTVQPGHDFYKKITGKYFISRRSGNLPALIFLKSFRPGVFHPWAGPNYYKFINNYFRLFFNFYDQPRFQSAARRRQYSQFQKLYQQMGHGAPGLPGLSSAPFGQNNATSMKTSWNYTFSFQKSSVEHNLFLGSRSAKDGQGRALITLVSGKEGPIRGRGPWLQFVNRELVVSEPPFVTKQELGLYPEPVKSEAPGLKPGETKIDPDFWRLEKSYGSSRLTELIPGSFVSDGELARKDGQPAQREGIFAQFRVGARAALIPGMIIPQTGNPAKFINNYFRLFFNIYDQPRYQPAARRRQYLQFQKLYQQMGHGAPGLPGLSGAPFGQNNATYMKTSWNYTFSFQKSSVEHNLFLGSRSAKDGQGRALITLVSGKEGTIRGRGPWSQFVNRELVVSKPSFVTKQELGLYPEPIKSEAPGLKPGETKIDPDFWRLEKSYGSSRLTELIPGSFISETRELARNHYRFTGNKTVYVKTFFNQPEAASKIILRPVVENFRLGMLFNHSAGSPSLAKGAAANRGPAGMDRRVLKNSSRMSRGGPLSLELSNPIPDIDSQIIGRNETERLKSKAGNLARGNKAPKYTEPVFETDDFPPGQLTRGRHPREGDKGVLADTGGRFGNVFREMAKPVAGRLSTRGHLRNQLAAHIRENNLISEPMRHILTKFSLDGAGRNQGKTGPMSQEKKAITTARNELFAGKIRDKFFPATHDKGLAGMPLHTRRPDNAGLPNQINRPARMIEALENINLQNLNLAPPGGRGLPGPVNRLAENSGALIFKKSLPPNPDPEMENGQIREEKPVTTSSASNHFIHEEKANAFPGINRIADQVYKILEKRLAIEKDWRGLR